MAKIDKSLSSRKAIVWNLLLFVLLLLPHLSFARTYLTTENFIKQSFSETPAPKVIWVKGQLKQQLTAILGHPYAGLRIKYWFKEGKSLWVLNEVGKERPITVGIIIEGDSVESVQVLAYRETRGSEVRHHFFLKQFIGATSDDDHTLSKHIDGITGATLSVRALTKLTQIALLLHERISISINE